VAKTSFSCGMLIMVLWLVDLYKIIGDLAIGSHQFKF
jgi:hypothetical protein